MPGTAAVFVIKDGDTVLMEWRDDHPFLGKLSFPGGKIEPGEDPDEALERELAEELGLRPRQPPVRLEPVVSGTWTIYPYLLLGYDGGCPAYTDAGAELVWVPLHEACEVQWYPARTIALQVNAYLAKTSR